MATQLLHLFSYFSYISSLIWTFLLISLVIGTSALIIQGKTAVMCAVDFGGDWYEVEEEGIAGYEESQKLTVKKQEHRMAQPARLVGFKKKPKDTSDKDNEPRTSFIIPKTSAYKIPKFSDFQEKHPSIWMTTLKNKQQSTPQIHPGHPRYHKLIEVPPTSFSRASQFSGVPRPLSGVPGTLLGTQKSVSRVTRTAFGNMGGWSELGTERPSWIPRRQKLAGYQERYQNDFVKGGVIRLRQFKKQKVSEFSPASRAPGIDKVTYGKAARFEEKFRVPAAVFAKIAASQPSHAAEMTPISIVGDRVPTQAIRYPKVRAPISSVLAKLGVGVEKLDLAKGEKREKTKERLKEGRKEKNKEEKLLKDELKEGKLKYGKEGESIRKPRKSKIVKDDKDEGKVVKKDDSIEILEYLLQKGFHHSSVVELPRTDDLSETVVGRGGK